MTSDLLSSTKAEEFVDNTKIKVLQSMYISGIKWVHSRVFQNVSFGHGHLILL